MTRVTCPICERPFELENSPAPPFCSDRCRQIDLGTWLDEGYGMPIEREDDFEAEPDD